VISAELIINLLRVQAMNTAAVEKGQEDVGDLREKYISWYHSSN
jgi:hypothetical protein